MLGLKLIHVNKGGHMNKLFTSTNDDLIHGNKHVSPGPNIASPDKNKIMQVKFSITGTTM